jgi:hypothetical protein
MDLKTIPVTTFIVTSFPFAAGAQSAIGRTEERGARGELAATPVAAVVVGARGAPVGIVDGILGVEERLRFREYLACKHHP